MKPFNDTYVMYYLLEFIEESSIIVLCKASKKLNEICKQYIELEDDKRFEVCVSDYWWYSSRLFEECCLNNNIIQIRKIIKMDKMDLYWNNALYAACRSGHVDIVKFLIEKGARHWNKGLEGACQFGHTGIIKLMIEKGATKCCYCYKSMEAHLSLKKLMKYVFRKGLT